jgi:hypothetical protein
MPKSTFLARLPLGWTYQTISDDTFVRGYIGTVLAVNFRCQFTIADVSQDFLESAVEDCKLFREANFSVFSPLYLNEERAVLLREAGCSFWRVRNGYDGRFSQYYWGTQASEALTRAARRLGKLSVFANPDDGLIYVGQPRRPIAGEAGSESRGSASWKKPQPIFTPTPIALSPPWIS